MQKLCKFKALYRTEIQCNCHKDTVYNKDVLEYAQIAPKSMIRDIEGLSSGSNLLILTFLGIFFFILILKSHLNQFQNLVRSFFSHQSQ